MDDADQEFLSALGLTIRALRERAGRSQEAFALQIGLHRTYVGAIERGERNIGVLVLRVLAEGLGVDIGDLLHEAERVCKGLSTMRPS